MPVSTGVLYAANPVAGLTDSSGGSAADSIKPGVGKTVLPIFIDLPTLADGDIVTTVTPGFAGSIDVTEFYVHEAVTTASKASTLNLEIGTTNLTGGSIALTSANCTPAGAKISGSSITGNNTFTASQTISVEAASTTAFVEGSGWLVLSLTNDDEANAFATVVAKQSELHDNLRDAGLVEKIEPLGAGQQQATSLQIVIETTSPNQTFTLPLGNTGTYDAIINWGDGTSDDITTYNDVDLAHTYALAKKYTLSITGTLPWIYFNNGGDKDLVKEVVLYDVGSTTFAASLYGCSNLISVSGASSGGITDFSWFVRRCSSLTTLDLSSLNSSSANDLSNFARDCTSLAALNISSLDTSSVANFFSFVRGCSNLSTLLMSGIDLSSATNFSFFAGSCSALTSFSASVFDSCPCTNFADAFFGCALDQTSVDNILVSINAANTSNGTLDIDGGANAAPGAAGTAAISDLTGRGWVVTTN